MSGSITFKSVNIIINNNQYPINATVIVTFDSISEKNRIMYLLKKEEKIEYQKYYNSINKDQYLSYQKDYYEKKRETILAEKKEKVICECGSVTSVGNLNSHKKTSLHTKRLNKKFCMNI
jgi:hypothetical protein